MGKVANRHKHLLIDVGQEWSLVIYTEGEDTVLIWEDEMCRESGAVYSCSGRRQGQTVEWREHAELELDLVLCWRHIWLPFCVNVLRKFDGESLQVSFAGTFENLPHRS